MALLTGKTAVITGGTTGIGLATAKQFVEQGAHVFITGRRQAELDTAVKELGDQATGVQGDVSKLEDLDRLYAAVADSGRRVDVVFANAAVVDVARIGEITEEHLDYLLGVDLKGVVFTVQKALPLLNDGASVILNASNVASRGADGDRGVRRDQGRAAVVRAHLGKRVAGQQDSRQRGQPRRHRHPRHRDLGGHAEPRSGRG